MMGHCLFYVISSILKSCKYLTIDLRLRPAVLVSQLARSAEFQDLSPHSLIPFSESQVIYMYRSSTGLDRRHSGMSSSSLGGTFNTL